MKKIIYLDNAATTALNNAAFSLSVDFYKRNFFNPSALYKEALTVKAELENARQFFSSCFCGGNVIFTSCGTEADNTAMFGFAKKGKIVTTKGEHAAIFASAEKLRLSMHEVFYADLNDDGSVNVDSLLSLINNDVSLVSVVHVNNETGAKNDINEIASKVKKLSPRTIFHSDGVQAFCKVPFKPNPFIDAYSISAHKIGAVKGVGALLTKKGINVTPYIVGGAQEKGLRAGTENVLGILDFYYSARENFAKIDNHLELVKKLKSAFIENLDAELFTVLSGENASPYIVTVAARGLRGAVLQNMLRDEGIIVGTGSACSSKNPHSRVIKATGKNKDILDGVLRISFIFDTELYDVILAAKTLNQVAVRLKEKLK